MPSHPAQSMAASIVDKRSEGRGTNCGREELRARYKLDISLRRKETENMQAAAQNWTGGRDGGGRALRFVVCSFRIAGFAGPTNEMGKRLSEGGRGDGYDHDVDDYDGGGLRARHARTHGLAVITATLNVCRSRKGQKDVYCAARSTGRI